MKQKNWHIKNIYSKYQVDSTGTNLECTTAFCQHTGFWRSLHPVVFSIPTHTWNKVIVCFTHVAAGRYQFSMSVQSSPAGMTRMTGMTRITGMTGITRITGMTMTGITRAGMTRMMTEITGMTRMTGMTGMTGITGMTRITGMTMTGITGMTRMIMTGITGMTGMTRMTMCSPATTHRDQTDTYLRNVFIYE